jgi:hypothetical protein
MQNRPAPVLLTEHRPWPSQCEPLAQALEHEPKPSAQVVVHAPAPLHVKAPQAAWGSVPAVAGAHAPGVAPPQAPHAHALSQQWPSTQNVS